MRTIEFNKLRKIANKEVNNRLNDNNLKYINLYEFNKYIKTDEILDLKTVNNSKFENKKLKDIQFENIEFLNCSFENSIFINCKFYKVKFTNCSFKNSILKYNKLNNIVIECSNLKKGIFINCHIDYITIKDCDLKAFKLTESYIYNLEFDDSLVTKFNEDTFFDELNNESYESCYKFYRAIAYKFQENNLLAKYGEYLYMYKYIERKTLKGINRFKSKAFWLICGYGERPTYALITSLEIIFIFTILYLIFGLKIGSEIISYKELFFTEKPTNVMIDDFVRAFHFSIVTFTTVGYGDITPFGYSIFLSGIEMFLGVTMVGIWTATLARKINR
ncbi:hypothetical protein GCM10008904_18600 [Paraclostridium ghonii]|uniref:Potassium channel domain-containing protein n=1 Tax=Paraclostridium ghonii TaxID=29358 RepID=A0ABU0MWY5_9FIRM|nr:pentapeptide repeat-containing protein [Paeniclostridium ghonii]MDQ0555113.1 hypothetical protein [Paeniclostridium ghonii]